MPVGIFQRRLQQAGIVADIEGEAEAILVRQLLRRQQVLRADFVDADARLLRGGLDHALHDVGRLRPPRAAIGVGGRGVGDDAVHQIVNGRKAVDAAHDAAACEGLDRGAELRLIGAEVGPGLHAQRQDHAVFVQRDLRIGLHRAAGRVGLEGIAALAGPLHRPPKGARRMQDEAVFGVDKALHAETAADIAGDEPKAFRLHLHHGLGKVPMHACDALAADGEGKAGLLIIFADRASDLHRHRRDLVLHEVALGDVGGFCKGCIHRLGVADLPVEQLVRWGRLPHLLRAACQRGIDVVNGGQVFIVDHHRFGSAPCGLARLGNDEGDAVADEARVVAGEEIARGLNVARERYQAWDVAIFGDVVIGIDRQDPRHFPRRRNVDGKDPGVRVWRADGNAVGAALRRVIVRKAAFAGQQPLVLQPLRALSDTEFHPLRSSSSRTAARPLR